MNRIVLFLYNLLFFPLLLILLPGYLLRMKRRGGYGTKAPQRFGIFDRNTRSRIGTGRIWIHASSVGEVGIALKFAEEYHSLHPRSRFLLSVTTSTGLAIAERKACAWLEAVANPVDFPILTARLVRRLRPSVLLSIEADLWPNRVAACRRLGIPVALLNARLSKRSERRFQRVRWLAAPFFNSLDLITLTDPGDRECWISLGVRPELLRLTGNMKHDAVIGTPAGSMPHPLQPGWSATDPLFLAASTHEGEEQEVARAFQRLRKEIPNLRLLIAPRHVERRNAIVASLGSLGLTCSLRSEPTSGPADLLLLDTTGELARWYEAATVAFVGKSLPCAGNRGGQNMIEPLQAGCPVLIGPHTGNFEPLASQLCDAGAAVRVTDAESLSEAALRILRDEPLRSGMIGSAAGVLEAHRGATRLNCALVAGLFRGSLPEEMGGA